MNKTMPIPMTKLIGGVEAISELIPHQPRLVERRKIIISAKKVLIIPLNQLNLNSYPFIKNIRF